MSIQRLRQNRTGHSGPQQVRSCLSLVLGAGLARYVRLRHGYTISKVRTLTYVAQGTCLQWAKSGARAVVLAGRRRAQLDEVAAEINASPSTTRTMVVRCDVSSHGDVKNLFETAAQNYGKVDIVVHAAGVLGPVTNVGEALVDEWWSAFVRTFPM